VPAPVKTRFEPTLVAPETFLIHDHHGEGVAPVSVGFNALVIRAAEPVVIDTGMAENRDQYLADVCSLVEPEEIRWVVISHDDVDHTGNLNALMELAPNATAVVSWFMGERMGASLEVSPMRQRWVDDGGSLDVGDRTLHFVRPPVFDSPTTRGIFDPTTRVYWGSDAFAAPMPTPVTDVADLDPEEWIAGMATFDNYVSPWLRLVDDARYQATVDRVAALDPSVLVGCHTPVIRGTHVLRALKATRLAPTATFDPEPDQAVLEEIQRAMAAAGVDAEVAA
jgi:flavorubredoxin